MKKKTKKVVNTITGRVSTYIEARCDCCHACWIDQETGVCECGGPFSGYRRPDGKTYTVKDFAPA